MTTSSPHASLLYACVAYNATVLAEGLAPGAGSQPASIAALVLPRIDHSKAQKLTYTHGTHYIHYISEGPNTDTDAGGVSPADARLTPGGITFLVVADAAAGRRIPFAFLSEVREQFFDDFQPTTTLGNPTVLAQSPPYGCAAFNSKLKQLLRAHDAPDHTTDTLANAQRDIEDVRGIMGRNIESLLDRGEHIDLLVDQTDRLGGSARDFRIRSRGLKRQMWWKNVKLMALLALVVVLIVLTIVLSVKA